MLGGTAVGGADRKAGGTACVTLTASSALTALVFAVGLLTTSQTKASENPYDRVLQRQLDRLAALKGRPEAAAPLAVIAGLADDLLPSQIEAAVHNVADDPASDPLVEAQAAALLADLLDQRGEVKEATARRTALGLLTRPWVVGPFGEGRASFAQAFAPEKEGGIVDPARRYAGKEREVAWRPAAAAVRQGMLLVDGMLRPDNQTSAFAVWVVGSETAREAAVRIGSPGPFKVWVNGVLVGSRDVVRATALDQDACAIRLRRGANRILIKTVITDGPWRLLVRITDRAGRALVLPEEDAAATAAGVVVTAPPTRATGGAPVRTLEALLRARVAKAPSGPAGAQALLDLGQFLIWNAPTDRDARDDATALEQSIARRPSVEALLALADVARDDDERRRALERAAGLAAADATAAEGREQHAVILAKLGEVARQQHRDTVAVERWRQALRLDAHCWPAAVALAEEEQTAGLSRVAASRLEVLPVALRGIRRVGMQLVRLWEALDRHADADALLALLQSQRRSDPEIAHHQSMRARQRSDGAGAIAALERA
ncbi:MAG: hypothetical protein QOI66_1556, partial [Myxococcales bacterium]|nr:hypothetical protein [Myxococcales bacterium]